MCLSLESRVIHLTNRILHSGVSRDSMKRRYSVTRSRLLNAGELELIADFRVVNVMGILWNRSAELNECAVMGKVLWSRRYFSLRMYNVVPHLESLLNSEKASLLESNIMLWIERALRPKRL